MRPPGYSADRALTSPQRSQQRPDLRDAAERSPSAGKRALSRVLSVPRCGVSSPFKGHLSVKSNAFYIGRDSRLSDQYRIRDHMLIHYNKILGAKAAVDCSVPKSMIKSIKYSDQQRREKMNREVTRFEREPSLYRSPTRPNSRENGESSIIHRKDTYDGYTNMLRQSPYSDPRNVCSPSSFLSTSPRQLRSPESTAELDQRDPDFSRMASRMRCGFSNSPGWSGGCCRFQDNQRKICSGDLLEKHSRHFTEAPLPFTPRTLKTHAKSVLAQYRCYSAPRRKRREIVANAEAQTDLSSFQHRSPAQETEPPSIRQVTEDEASRESPDGHRGHLPLREEEKSCRRFSETLTDRRQPSLSREEELGYLNFVVAVTNEILTLGLFSDRVVDRIFERHLQENRHNLDEDKMRHLLDILRADLGSKHENHLKSFVDNRSGNSEHLSSLLAPQGGVRNEASHSWGDFSQDGINDGQHQKEDLLIYLDEIDSESQIRDNVLSGRDTRDVGHEQETDFLVFIEEDTKQNNVRSGQDEGDGLLTADAAWCCPDERGSDRLPEDHFLTCQDDRGENDHGFHNDDDLLGPEKASEVDNLLLDDGDVDQISFSDGSSALVNLADGSRDTEKTDLLKDLEDLEQSFSEIIQVSKDEDPSDLVAGDLTDPGEDSEGETDYSKIQEQIEF